MAFFIFDDPFGIFYKNKCLAEGSDDVIKTRKFLSEKEKFTSFIFGNSRAHAFTEDNWQKHIGKEPVFEFSSPGESVLNIKKKIELILKYQEINNALILIDVGILENTDNAHKFYKGPVYQHLPVTSTVSYFGFYSDYVKYYFQDCFFMKHIYYRLTGNYVKQWMQNSFKDPSVNTQSINSKKYATLADSLLENNFNLYKSVFKPEYTPFPRKLKAVSVTDSLYFTEIKKTLDNHKVNYKIVIPPDFNGAKIEPQIYKTIYSIFGNTVYDFTGVNKISVDSTLNYENLHFTARAGVMILDSLYKN